jgi:hypothetical protein
MKPICALRMQNAEAGTIVLLNKYLNQRRTEKLKCLVKNTLSRFLYPVPASPVGIEEISWT